MQIYEHENNTDLIILLVLLNNTSYQIYDFLPKVFKLLHSIELKNTVSILTLIINLTNDVKCVDCMITFIICINIYMTDSV